MVNNAGELDAVLKQLLGRLQPVKLRRAMRQVSRYLKRSNKKRVTQQKNASGDKWRRRKDTRNKTKMLTGFKKNIQDKASENKAEVGIYGRAARLAGVHNGGEVEGGIQYAERQLIGLSESDAREVEKILYEFIL